MDEYCNYKDAFDNNNSELDKMAKTINNKRIKNNDKKRLQYLSSNSSISFSPSDSNENLSDFDNISDLSSSYSDLSPKLKKNLRLTTQHLESKDEHKIIDHIQTCDECKNELMKIMNVKHMKKKYKKMKSNEDDTINNVLISNDDMKNLLIILIIGLIIIIIINKA
jgi:hypothetical protein